MPRPPMSRKMSNNKLRFAHRIFPNGCGLGVNCLLPKLLLIMPPSMTPKGKIRGRSVMKKTLFPAQNGFYQSSLTGLSQGVYLYEINEGNVVQKGQIMIQHP